jgi:hypothetical protein
LSCEGSASFFFFFLLIIVVAVVDLLLDGLLRLVELEVDRGLDWDRALARYHNFQESSPMTGFYVSKRDMFGSKMYILITPKDASSTHIFHVAR